MYAPNRGEAAKAETEAVFTMAPPPPSIIAGIACLQPRKTPVRVTAIVRSHSERLVSVTDLLSEAQ